MGIKIHVSSDRNFEGKTALVMLLEKVLKRSGVRKVTAHDEMGVAYLPAKDESGNIISADDFFTDTIMCDRFSEVEIIELSEHPDLDPPKCDCH